MPYCNKCGQQLGENDKFCNNCGAVRNIEEYGNKNNNIKTKRCIYCRSEIDIQAKVCPQCNRDLRNYFEKHPVFITIVGMFIFLTIVGMVTTNRILDSNTNNTQTSISTGIIETKKEITLKQKISEKDWEITIKETGFKQDIKPTNPNSFYTHYQVKDTDNTYFYLIINAKNISTLELRADKVAKVKMKYNNKYEYTTFSTVEEKGGGSFTYTNITGIDPLTSRTLYYLVEVPKAIANEKDTPLEAEIVINNNTYYLKIR